MKRQIFTTLGGYVVRDDGMPSIVIQTAPGTNVIGFTKINPRLPIGISPIEAVFLVSSGRRRRKARERSKRLARRLR